MKKIVSICIFVFMLIVSFVFGMVFANRNQSKNEVVGVYQTDSWNGKTGTLVLYEDGKCQYPTGDIGTWKANKDTLIIYLTDNYVIDEDVITGMTIKIDNTVSEERLNEILDSIEKLPTIDGIDFRPATFTEGAHTCFIHLYEGESDNKTCNELKKIQEITIEKYEYGSTTGIDEHQAKIMEKGIVLHEHFFEKVSD